MEKPIFLAAALAVAVGQAAVAASPAAPDTIVVDTPVYYAPLGLAFPGRLVSTDVRRSTWVR
ncbi:MAG: hypothetical protein K2G82_09130, partial [Paramuribaculum sp.]|nr:hypothetical protein [Paramuribaculum sp.]